MCRLDSSNLTSATTHPYFILKIDCIIAMKQSKSLHFLRSNGEQIKRELRKDSHTCTYTILYVEVNHQNSSVVWFDTFF